jgi:hypothetical protein
MIGNRPVRFKYWRRQEVCQQLPAEPLPLAVRLPVAPGGKQRLWAGGTACVHKGLLPTVCVR